MTNPKRVALLGGAAACLLFAAYVRMSSRGSFQARSALLPPESTRSAARPDPRERPYEAPRTHPRGVEARRENAPLEAAAGRPTPLEEAAANLRLRVDESLDGILLVNQLLDQVLAFADLPVEEAVDFEYEDSDDVAYRIAGTPPGITAHFLVGLQSFERDEKVFRALRIEIQMDAGEAAGFHRDSMREGPRVHLSLDHDESGRPGYLGLLTERRVDLRQSRRSGVDAYQGRFTSGASCTIDLTRMEPTWSETFGIIDGNYASGQDFQGIPLRGDLRIDPSRVEALSRRFLIHFQEVRRKVK